MRLYECKVEPQNLLINVKINGALDKAIVDTSAQISVINSMLANSLTPSLHIGKKVTLKVGEENSWLKANYSKDANSEIEGVQFKWPVIMADITDQVTLVWTSLLHTMLSLTSTIKASRFKEYKLRQRYLKLKGIQSV